MRLTKSVSFQRFCFPQLVSQISQKHHQNEGVSRHIQTKLAAKLLHRFQSTFAQQQLPPNTLLGWSEYAYNKSNITDTCYTERPKNRNISTQLFAILIKNLIQQTTTTV